ncbi:MAG: chitin binding peritrophin-A domain-containing protein [Nostoc sp. CreGUA01]|nr:chitin binding peritrophin-A domain-containing protein [Nostoc sp. CreGUA01]
MKKLLLYCCAMLLAMCVAISPALAADDSNICQSEGFFPNTENCTKFIRCVDNGQGSLQKYEFDCGPGTVYDTDSPPGTCNHPWALSPSNRCSSEYDGKDKMSLQHKEGESLFALSLPEWY